MQIRPFVPADRERVIGIWRDCNLVHQQNDPDLDIDRKVRHDPGQFLVGELGGELVASVMFGYDGHRGSVNYLAVDPQFQGRGFASRLLGEVERRLGEMGCPKINLQVRNSNSDVIGFYEARGYQVDDVLSLGKRLEVRP